eukprot:g2095.t1
MKISIVGAFVNKPRRRVLRPVKTKHAALFASSTSTATMTVSETVSASPPKPVSDVLAGATARVASQATVHPLDTLKVRMQTSVKTTGAVKGLGKPLPAIHRAARNVLTLYKGVLGSAAAAGFGIGTYFAFYSTAKKLLKQRTNLSPGAVAFISAGSAAAGCSVIKVPLSVCIRSVQAGVYKNAMEAAVCIFKAAGLRGLFTGYLPTFVEDVPDMAVKFAVYETMRSVHKKVFIDRQPSAQEDFIMGAVSGALAAACTTPVDVVKTNMMCQAASRPSMMTVAKHIMATQGPGGFLKGVGPRALSNGINSAVFFCFFEAFRSVMIKRQNKASSYGTGVLKTDLNE